MRRKAAAIVFRSDERAFTGHARIIAALPLHRFAAAQLDAHHFGHLPFRRPRLQIVFGLAIQKRAARLTHLLAQIRSGDEDFGDDLCEAIGRGLQRAVTLCRVLPHPIEIRPQVRDGIEVFK